MTRCHHFWVFIQRTQNSQRHTRPVVTAALLAGGRDTEAAEVSVSRGVDEDEDEAAHTHRGTGRRAEPGRTWQVSDMVPGPKEVVLGGGAARGTPGFRCKE